MFIILICYTYLGVFKMKRNKKDKNRKIKFPTSVVKNIKKVYFLLKIGFSLETKCATINLYRKYSDKDVFRLF